MKHDFVRQFINQFDSKDELLRELKLRFNSKADLLQALKNEDLNLILGVLRKPTYIPSIFTVPKKSALATLRDLKIDGTTVTGFASDILTYNVELATGTTAVPIVTATVTDIGKANAVVTAPVSLPGETTVVVTAEDGTTTKTYSIIFTVAPSNESITSKTITNFNYETVYATQARAVSKSITTNDFRSSPAKGITISDRVGNVIPVNMNVFIPLNEYTPTNAAALGSYIESIIQMWFQSKFGPTDWVSQMTVSASYNNDKLVITTFEAGSNAFVQIGGSNWSDFYDNSDKIYGTNDDTQLNRTFTINDGTNTVTITLAYSYLDMSDLVSDIDYMLGQSQVSVTVEKVDENHFRLVAKIPGIHLTIGGVNKEDFFS